MNKLLIILERIALAAERQAQAGERIAQALEKVAASAELGSVAASVTRLADRLAPEPSDVVDTAYVAGRLGCTTTWVAEMVRQHQIPRTCVVPGTGNGKIWKFYRARIDEWLASR
jgi:hypothetical protein